MADNDIYNNKKKYETFVNTIKDYLKPPKKDDRRRKYWIKNPKNIKYFEQMFKVFDSRDNSYIRRLRLLRSFLIVTHILNKDLKEVTDRQDIDKIMTFAHSVNKASKTKHDFVIDLKYIWKTLFPEKDEKGRTDDTLIPYVVRHLNSKIDKSKEKLKMDKFSLDEFEKLINAFGNDARMQALLSISIESLARPQELLGRKIKDVELGDNYAKIYITEHGKEGVGFLRVIDSYYYLTKWLNQHPLKKNPEAYLFINLGRVNMYKQLNPFGANKVIKDRCAKIGLNKPITLYSLKRNGVTMKRLSGVSDIDIQHTARWTSTKQLKTYDMSNQEESFKIELIKRGRIKATKKYEEYLPTTKKCVFCDVENGISETICSNCQRPLDREMILKQSESKDKEIEIIKKQMKDLAESVKKSNENIVQDLFNMMKLSGVTPEIFQERILEKNPKLKEKIKKNPKLLDD